MRPSVAKIASTLGLAVTLGLTFAPLGCDSTQALPFPAKSVKTNALKSRLALEIHKEDRSHHGQTYGEADPHPNGDLHRPS